MQATLKYVFFRCGYCFRLQREICQQCEGQMNRFVAESIVRMCDEMFPIPNTDERGVDFQRSQFFFTPPVVTRFFASHFSHSFLPFSPPVPSCLCLFPQALREEGLGEAWQVYAYFEVGKPVLLLKIPASAGFEFDGPYGTASQFTAEEIWPWEHDQ